MKILIIGGSGMLGHKLVQTLQGEFDVYTTLRNRKSEFAKLGIIEAERVIAPVDVENWKQVLAALEQSEPDVIINATGITKQDPSSNNVITTLSVNSIFPHRLAELVSQTGQKLITISTDCVFSGEKGNYVESDASDAIDLYGKSKYLGEVSGANCLTLRTSMIGREIATSRGLIEWFLSNRGGTVRGFVNAIFSGFPTTVLSKIVRDIIMEHLDLEGMYHVSSEPISKYALLCLVCDAYQLDVEIEPFEDFRIDRSLNSEKFRNITGFSPHSWHDMIAEMATDPTPYELWKNGQT